MTFLIALEVLWIFWKLLKFSFRLLWLLIIIALIATFVKVLLIPGLILIAGLLTLSYFHS